MIEAGQAVYFIENRGMDPVIKFGIVRDLWEERGFYHYAVDFLSIKEHRYIKGIGNIIYYRYFSKKEPYKMVQL